MNATTQQPDDVPSRFGRNGTAVSDSEHTRIADALEWIMDGEPLTSLAERERYEPLDLAA